MSFEPDAPDSRDFDPDVPAGGQSVSGESVSGESVSGESVSGESVSGESGWGPSGQPLPELADTAGDQGPLDRQTNAVEADAFGRLHPTSLIFDAITNLRSMLVPALIAFFSAAQGSKIGLIIAAVIFVMTVGHSIVHYLSLRFRVKDGELVVNRGFIFRQVRTVPTKRIQNVDLVQNVLHRLFGVAEVRVETASGTKPEATLRVLSMPQIEELRNEIFGRSRQRQEPAIPQGDLPGEDANRERHAAAPELLHAIPPSMLARAGFASDRGVILLGVLAGAYYQFDLYEKFRLDQLWQFMPKHLSTVVIVSGSIALGLLLLLVLRVVGVIWYLLRFYDYRLTRSGEDLRISCGLFTKVSATVPQRRIQFISIHRSFMMRWMKLAAIRIETAGGAGNQEQDAAKTVSSRWFIPVVDEQNVSWLLHQLRPGIDWRPDHFDWQPLAPRAAVRMCRLAVVKSLIIGVVGLAITRPWGWIAGLVVAPLFILLAVKKSRAMRYAQTSDGIVYRSGVITRKSSVTFFEKVQTLRVNQSPFDRRWRMATLSIDTAGSGPAEHRIEIPYLDATFAEQEFGQLKQQAAFHQPVFG